MRHAAVCRPRGKLQIDDTCELPVQSAAPMINVAAFGEMKMSLHVVSARVWTDTSGHGWVPHPNTYEATR